MPKPLIYLSVLYLMLLGLSWPAHLQSGDNQLSIATAEAIVFEQTLLIDESYQHKTAGRPPVDVEGKTYSRFGIGLPILYTPLAILSSIANNFVDPELARHSIFSLIPPLFGILNYAALFLIFRQLGANQTKSALISFIVSVYTLIFRYSVHDHSEVIQSAFFLGALLLLLKDRSAYQLPAFCLLAFTVLIKDYNIVIVGLYGLFALWLAVKRGDLLFASILRMGAPLAAAIALILSLNFYRFGNPFTSAYGDEVQKFGFDFFLRDAWPLLFSFEMGYFTFTPILLLATGGLVLGLKKRPALCLTLLGSFFFLWMLSAFFWAPKGAWSLGPRYMVPSVSLIGIGLVFLDFRKRFIQWSLAVLLVPATLLTLLYVLQKTQEYDVIRFNLAKEPEAMPPQILGLGKTLALKAQGYHQQYPADAFTTVSQQQDFDLSNFQTYLHVNTWYSHLENETGLPLRVPLLTLHLLLFVAAFFSVLFLLFRGRIEDSQTRPTTA